MICNLLCKRWRVSHSHLNRYDINLILLTLLDKEILAHWMNQEIHIHKLMVSQNYGSKSVLGTIMGQTWHCLTNLLNTLFLICGLNKLNWNDLLPILLPHLHGTNCWGFQLLGELTLDFHQAVRTRPLQWVEQLSPGAISSKRGSWFCFS